MSGPLVSVLMTSYNREKYIGVAIESVLASTYQNFELIIVDDGSKDDTVRIAKSYADKDSRVKVYQNPKNLGDYPNRNQAAAYATGKYLKYVDADDYIYPTGLETLINMMEQFPTAGWGLCSLLQYYKQPFPFILSPKEAYEYNYLGPGIFHKAPLSAIIKKDVFNAVSGFNNIRMAGDFEMWNRLGQKYPVVLMPDGIVWYREHDAQEMNSYRKFVKLYADIKMKYLLSDDCPLDKGAVKAVIKRSMASLRKEMLKSIIKMDIAAVKENLMIHNIHRNSIKS
ncbi:MAG TPA: glycosyltransferase family 2 protein [Flavipsychrobacter sp.]